MFVSHFEQVCSVFELSTSFSIYFRSSISTVNLVPQYILSSIHVLSTSSLSCLSLPQSELFNRYVQLTGCTGHLGPVTLGENTPLLHLLSCPSEHNTDLLFTVIKDVVR